MRNCSPHHNNTRTQKNSNKHSTIHSRLRGLYMKIGIIGKGNVGTAIGTGLSRKGHDVKFGHRDPKEPVADAAKWGEAIILAVPYENMLEAGKTLAQQLTEKSFGRDERDWRKYEFSNRVFDISRRGVAEKAAESPRRESLQHRFRRESEHRQSWQ